MRRLSPGGHSRALERQRRIWQEEALSNMARASADKVPGEKPTTESLSVHEMLYLARDRLTILFDLWDEDRDGELSLAEFRNAMRMSGLRSSEADTDAFFNLADFDHSRRLSLEELLDAIKTPPLTQAKQRNEPPPPSAANGSFVVALVQTLYIILNSKVAQLLLYGSFVATTQMLIHTLRAQEEYYLDKSLSDTLM
jgi:hypothetical protein